MTDPVNSTRSLRQVFASTKGPQVAVDSLDLDVPAGGVHGFLGPNGSGKTTTIRMLLGLASASSGSRQLFGIPVPSKLPEVIGRVGAVVESAKFAPQLSGRRNLMLLPGPSGWVPNASTRCWPRPVWSVATQDPSAPTPWA